MPNFDGTGLLKRERVIGRDLGPCKKCADGCECQTNPAGLPIKKDSPNKS